MSVFYINVGIKHFIDPEWFLHIIPPYLTHIGLELVYISGLIEILLGVLDISIKYFKRGRRPNYFIRMQRGNGI